MQALYIQQDGTLQAVEPKNKKSFDVSELTRYIGGQIEIIAIGGDDLLIVNEIGSSGSQAVNEEATKVVREKGFEHTIFGNALLCDYKLIV